MKSEMELVKCVLITFKLLSEIRDIRNVRSEIQNESSLQVSERWRARVWPAVRAAISIATLMVLKGSGAIYYAVSLAEHVALVM